MSKDKSGKSLEKAVARIQQLLDPGSVVTHNEHIVDRLGNRRQFDVVIRGQAAGRNYLGVVEAIEVIFKTATKLQIEGRNVDVTRLVMTAHRICRTKRGFVQVTGDAFYDWLAKGILLPIGGALQFQVTEAMVNNWEPFTGDVPSKKEFGGLIIEEFIGAMYDQQEVIYLEKYC